MNFTKSSRKPTLGADAHRIRQAVFVEEQKIPADMEWDAADESCTHAVAYNRLGRPLATGRLLEHVPGVAKIVKVGGTDIASALRKALELADPDNSKTTAVLLLTDGEDLTGAGQQAATELKDRGIVVHAIGYGSTRGSKITIDQKGAESFLKSDAGEEVVSALDSEGLRAIAAATGGEFVRADVMPLPLVELKAKRIDPMLQRTYEAGEETMHKTRFQWVLLPAVVLLLAELLRRGGRRR